MAACQASLSITNSWSLLKLMPIESVMPSNHLILCRPLLLPHSIFPSIRVFSNESALCIRWPEYWIFSFCFCEVHTISVLYCAHLCMKCSLGISNFLEEIPSLYHCIVFLYFFALITEEGFLISPCYSLELCIQMDVSFLFSQCLGFN